MDRKSATNRVRSVPFASARLVVLGKPFWQVRLELTNVKNFATSMDYYVNKLGFSNKWDWGTPPTFGCVTRDKVEIFLCEGAQERPGMWMSVFMDDVDSLHEEYRRSGAIIRLEPTNMPWGHERNERGRSGWSPSPDGQ